MKKSGFTLVEMLITISISAILLAVALPSFKNTINSSNMVSNTNGMIGAFNYARIEAIKRGESVNVAQFVDGDWTKGIEVKVKGTSEVLRFWPEFDGKTTVSSKESMSTFTFGVTGEVNNDDELTICDDRTGETGMKVSILVSGLIVSERVTCG